MLVLYHNNISVCSQRVRLVLEEKRVPWTSHHINLTAGEQLTPQFKAINPRGVVPVIVHDGTIIIESAVIAEYLDEIFPDPPLKPANAAERARMRVWSKVPDEGMHMACATLSFAIAFGRQLQEESGAGLAERLAKMPDPARRERQRQLIERGIEAPFFIEHARLYDRVMAVMERQLQATRWLAGDEYSLADIALIPYIERAVRLGLAGLWEPERPAVARWLGQAKARPSFASAVAAFPPKDFNDLGQRGLKDWPRIKELMRAS